MIRIGMLGADSTHTETYARLLNFPDSPYYRRGRITRLWGDNRSQVIEKSLRHDIPTVAPSPEDALRDVQLAIITTRYGNQHFKLAKIALEMGIPTFVNRPFTTSLEDAYTLQRIAAEKNVLIFSCSPLRYAGAIVKLQQELEQVGDWRSGAVAGYSPLMRHHGDDMLYVYGFHLVEMLVTVLGVGIETIRVETGSHADIVTLRYFDGRLVSLHLLRDSEEIYRVTLYCQKKTLTADVDAWGDLYERTLAHILTFVETGKVPFQIAETIEIMSILDAIERAKKLGSRVTLG